MAVLALGMAGALVAQTTCSLQGWLKDSEGEPMMFITNCVLLQRQDCAFAYGTTSDLDGVFSLASIRQGDYILRIIAVGHETYWQDIAIDRDTDLGVIEITDNAWYTFGFAEADSGDVCKHYRIFSHTVHTSYSTESMQNFIFSHTHYVATPTIWS